MGEGKGVGREGGRGGREGRRGGRGSVELERRAYLNEWIEISSRNPS